jgi:hypothetical protein
VRITITGQDGVDEEEEQGAQVIQKQKAMAVAAAARTRQLKRTRSSMWVLNGQEAGCKKEKR